MGLSAFLNVNGIDGQPYAWISIYFSDNCE